MNNVLKDDDEAQHLGKMQLDEAFSRLISLPSVKLSHNIFQDIEQRMSFFPILFVSCAWQIHDHLQTLLMARRPCLRPAWSLC